MGDGRDGHVGRDYGVRDACVPELDAHANGLAGHDGGQRSADGGRAARVLSGAEERAQTLCGEQYRVVQRRRPVRLGREDAGTGAVRVLLRVHTDALARRRPVPEVRRQAHHGPGHTVHGAVHAAHAVRRVHGPHAPDRLAVRRGTRRSETGRHVASRRRPWCTKHVCFHVFCPQGTTFPALCTLLAQWAPPGEKGKLSTVVFAGNVHASFITLSSRLNGNARPLAR